MGLHVPGNDASSGDQPAYRLAAIIDGTYDAYIRSWATGMAALPYPVVIRFAHEMNGFWYPWCEQSNGNRPGDYVAAWRHVHDLFADAGAHNVTWLWSPNVTYPGAAPLAGCTRATPTWTGSACPATTARPGARRTSPSTRSSGAP